MAKRKPAGAGAFNFGLDLDLGIGLGLDIGKVGEIEGVGDAGGRKPPDPDKQFLRGCRLNFAPVTWNNAKAAADRVDLDQDCFALVGGQFVMANFLEGVIFRHHCKVDEMYLTTLGMSADNMGSIVNFVDYLQVDKVNLIISHYWLGVERHKLFPQMMEEFASRPIQVAVVANHSKLCLMQTRSHGDITIFGSANLSSSDNLEVFALTHDKSVYDFSRGILQGIMDDFTIYEGVTDECRLEANKRNRGKTIYKKVVTDYIKEA